MRQKQIKPAWLNRDLRLELRKIRVYELWKKEQATQEDYKDVMKLRREKIRRCKDQVELEFSLACAVKDNKNAFKSVVKHWNKLPRKVLQVFKGCIDAVLWNVV